MRKPERNMLLGVKAVLVMALLLSAILLIGCSSNNGATGNGTTNNDTTNNDTAANGTTAPANGNDAVEDTVDRRLTQTAYELGFPIANNDITLDIVFIAAPEHGDYNEMLTFMEMERMSGININFNVIPRGEDERVHLMVNAGDYPDAFWGFFWGVDNMRRLGDQGIFICVRELMENHSPSFMQLMEEMPEVWGGMLTPEGNIFAYPQLMIDDLATRLQAKLFINQPFLDQVGLGLPRDYMEFYEMLRAFQTIELEDGMEVIPFIAPAYWTLSHYVKGMFGLNNRGSRHEMIVYDESTNELIFAPLHPAFKSYLQYMNKLVSEGLIYGEIFAGMDTALMSAFADAGVLGSYVFVNEMFSRPPEDWTQVPYMLRGPYGTELMGFTNPVLNTIAAFTITDRNQHPVETARWIDYFFSDEGGRLLLLGVEGITYEIDEDGEYVYKEFIRYADELWNTLAAFVPWTGIGHPGFRTPRFGGGIGQNTPSLRRMAEDLAPWVPEAWPDFMLTQEEMDRRMLESPDLWGYVRENEVAFIFGQRSFDEWDDFIDNIHRLGVEAFMETYTAAYQRFRGN